MIAEIEMRKLARGRLRDARALFRAGRFDAAAYMVGYGVEMALKARICRTLRWEAFPSRAKEFEHLHSFKTHRLETLLKLSGQEERIKTRYLSAWSNAAEWDPEFRYLPIGSTIAEDAKKMIDAVQALVRVL